MMLLSAVELEAAVRVLRAEGDSLELEDLRTGFRIAIDDCGSVSELQSFLASVGLLAGIELEQARLRQHAFLQDQAWEERLERVSTLLSRAVADAPYYRERRQEYGRDVSNRAALQRLPLLRRRDLKSHFLELCSERIDFPAELATGRLELASTSGTTDERVQAFADSTLTRIFSSYPELWGVRTPTAAPRTAVLTSPLCMAERCTRAGSMESRIVYEHTLFLPGPTSLFGITRRDVGQIAEELARFAPAIWLVNPVYAHWLVRAARAWEIELPRPDVVVCTYQYLSKIQKRELSRHLGVPVVNSYTATELGGCQMGLECGRGKLHVREDHCLLELLGPDGLPVSQGVGSVVVTTLANDVTPLVRYVIGDLAEAVTEPCDCSLREWPAIALHGREREALYFNGQYVTTREVDAVVSGVHGIDFYACRQLTEAALDVDVVRSTEVSFEPNALVTALQALLPTARVRINVVERLEPAPSLKFPLSLGLASKPAWLRA